MTDKPFDAEAELDALVRQFRPSKCARKLTFEGHCQVYACLYRGVPQYAVCAMFDISRATASHIAGCRDDTREPVTIEAAGHSETLPGGALNRWRRPQRRDRYRKVAAEFESLGEAEFNRRYFTPTVKARVKNALARIQPGKWFPDA